MLGPGPHHLLVHLAELPHEEAPPPQPHAFLAEEDRPWAVQLDENGDDQEQGRGDEQAQGRDRAVEPPLEPETRPALLEVDRLRRALDAAVPWLSFA